MNFLDRLLNKQRTNRSAALNDVVNASNASGVTNLTPKGIQFSAPDMRASSAHARHNANMILGFVPQNMYVRGQAPIGFEDNSDTYEQLTNAGIKVGSSMQDVLKVLRAQEQKDENMMKPNEGSHDAALHGSQQPGVASSKGGGGVSTGDGYLRDGGRTNPAASYQQGYQQPQSGNLDSMHLMTTLNNANERFQQLLHNTLFSTR